jgi:hypothetical protein
MMQKVKNKRKVDLLLTHAKKNLCHFILGLKRQWFKILGTLNTFKFIIAEFLLFK